jgi:uncharacterized protein involved in response to NO
MADFIKIQEPPRRAGLDSQRFALWDLGFRPFYLLASTFAALSIGLWALQFSGWLGHTYLDSSMWHAHEMLFGFALAVIVGFLFTAGRNWSGRPTPTGLPLAAIAALWVAGRVLVLTPFGWAAAIVNAAFPLAAAIALAIPFFAGGNRRNYFFVALLALMSVAVLVFHLARLDVLQIPGSAAIQIALDIILFIMAVMGGRVIPMFTNNGVPGAGATRNDVVEKLALASVLVLLVADVLNVGPVPLAIIAAFAAMAHAVRWLLWRPWKTLRTPLVWVLHAGYLWLALHLGLRAAAAVGWIGSSPATHALTAGAIGGLVIGMMTRTALGHTARPLRAGRTELACYVLITLSAVVRVFVPLAAPAQLVNAVLCSALLWSAGFGLYAARYWPILTRPRLDGLPG